MWRGMGGVVLLLGSAVAAEEMDAGAEAPPMRAPLTLSPDAIAPEPPPVPEPPPAPPPVKLAPWRGSRLTYAQAVAPLTWLAPVYDSPYWAQDVTAVVEWHFGELLYARARLLWFFRFTEPMGTRFSDAFLYFGWTGWIEPHTGIRLAADLLVTLPVSFASQLRGQLFSVGSRPALSWTYGAVTIGYGARPTFYLQRYQTSAGGLSGLDAPNYPVPIDPDVDALFSVYSGTRNPIFDLSHGPFLTVRPIESIALETRFNWDHGWLYSNSPYNRIELTRFELSARWQFTRPVGVGLSIITLGPDPNPILHRGTTVFLDLTFDIAGITSLF